MGSTHLYSSRIAWSGSTAAGYDAYDRRHAGAMPRDGITVPLSGDSAFGGDPALPNPEQLLVLAASSCQLLSFLAVAARARLDVLHYTDDAEGEMPDVADPTGLTAIRLRPVLTVVDQLTVRRTPVTVERVRHLCEVAHRECYVANSLTTPVHVDPTITLVPAFAPSTSIGDTFRP